MNEQAQKYYENTFLPFIKSLTEDDLAHGEAFVSLTKFHIQNIERLVNGEDIETEFGEPHEVIQLDQEATV